MHVLFILKLLKYLVPISQCSFSILYNLPYRPVIQNVKLPTIVTLDTQRLSQVFLLVSFQESNKRGKVTLWYAFVFSRVDPLETTIFIVFEMNRGFNFAKVWHFCI